MKEKYCYFDGGDGVCYATENDECPSDYDMICRADVDIHGINLRFPDDCIEMWRKNEC